MVNFVAMPSAADSKRQLGIKTRSVKRLAADVTSYLREKSTYQQKLDSLTSSSSTEPHELKRAREFVEEAESTIQDVRQRLQEAYVALENFMNELQQQGDAEVLADQCFVDARKMLDDVAPLVTVAADEHKERGFKITVVGGSALTEDDELWRPTEELGEKLARAGYHVLTGAYGGTAEGVSFGASRVPSSHIEGISCPSAYPARVSTQYLTVETTASDRFEREAGLVKHADAFIVLPGQLGTLAHLTQVWNVSVGETAQSKPPLCILAWRSPWEGVLTSIAGALKLPAAMVHAVTFVDSVDQAMEELEKMRQHKRNSKVGVHGAAASSSSSSSSSSAAAPTAAAP